MKLLSNEHREQMLANGKANTILRENDLAEQDFPPVVKLFCPWGAATWLLSELDPRTTISPSVFAISAWGFPNSETFGSVNSKALSTSSVFASNATFISRRTSRWELTPTRRSSMNASKRREAEMKNTDRKPRRDIYQEITNRIIAELEKGTAPWHKPWSRLA